jgi:hypothetical protein
MYIKDYYIYKRKMTNIPDYYNCNFGDFTKLVQAISGSKETEYEKMIDQLNTKYIELSTEIMRLNEKRLEHLNKIKYAQTEYRKLLGEGEITVSVDIDDNSDNEEKVIVEAKPGVRGRKKKEKVETVSLLEDIEEVEEAVVPEIKTKVKSKLKTSKTKQVSSDDEDLKLDLSEEEEEVKKSTKKTVSKKAAIEEVEEQVKSTKTTKKSNKATVVEEVEEQVKPIKTSKKTKDVEDEPIEEVKTKKSTKGTKK